MSIRASLPSTILRLAATKFLPSVTQVDMPETEHSALRIGRGRFDADLYRIYSRDKERSDLFRFLRPVLFVGAARRPARYEFLNVLAGADNRLELNQSQVSQLQAAQRIVPVYRGASGDVAVEHTGSLRDRLRGVDQPRTTVVVHSGLGLAAESGPLPRALYASEVYIPHLDRRSFVLRHKEREVRATLTFSSHCWTKPCTRAVSQTPVVVDEFENMRYFCEERYDLSKKLPAMFETLLSNKVYDTGRFNTYGLYRSNGTSPTAYTAFFSVTPSAEMGVVKIHVRSAYVERRPLESRGIDFVKHIVGGRQGHSNDDEGPRIGTSDGAA